MPHRFKVIATVLMALAVTTICQRRVAGHAPAKLEKANLGSTKPVHVAGDIYLAGQPSREDFDAIKSRGIRSVVNLRKPGEIDWDQAAHVASLGFCYTVVPFKEPESLTDEVFDEVRQLLRKTTKRPLLLHCSSANRVGAVWIPYRVLDEGVSLQQAVLEAKTVGMRIPAYEERARAYIGKQER